MDPHTLEHCLAAADDPTFAARLRDALLALPPQTLPLKRACTQGGIVDDTNLTVSVLASERSADAAVARVGVFFSERVGGCNCHDDPVETPAYGVIEIRLSAATGSLSVRYLGDG